MPAFYLSLAAATPGPEYTVPIVFWALVALCLFDRLLEKRSAKKRASSIRTKDLATRAEVSALGRKHEARMGHTEKRVSDLEQTYSADAREINRALGRIEGELKNLNKS